MIARAVKAPQSARSSNKRIRHVLVHTGQHYEHRMSGVFFEELELPDPDYNLEVGSGPQGAQTGAMLARSRRCFSQKSQMS